MNRVYIMTDDDPSEQYSKYIEDVALFTMSKEQCTALSCSIMCVLPETIRAYNMQYRNKDYVPDVLSFVDRYDDTFAQELEIIPGEQGDGNCDLDCALDCEPHKELEFAQDKKLEQESEKYIGDILICQNQIAIQAKEHKVPFIEELARIVIHGVLHLLGYLHETYDAHEPMLLRQEQILKFYTNLKGNLHETLT